MLAFSCNASVLLLQHEEKRSYILFMPKRRSANGRHTNRSKTKRRNAHSRSSPATTVYSRRTARRKVENKEKKKTRCSPPPSSAARHSFLKETETRSETGSECFLHAYLQAPPDSYEPSKCGFLCTSVAQSTVLPIKLSQHVRGFVLSRVSVGFQCIVAADMCRANKEVYKDECRGSCA